MLICAPLARCRVYTYKDVMDLQQQAPTSFIPKRPVATGATYTSSSGGGLAALIAVLIFVTSLVSAGGVFAYQQILKAGIAADDESLNKAQNAYDPSVIQDLIRLDARIKETQKLLAAHVSPSALFSFLSTLTLESVQFFGLEYKLEDGGAAIVTMTGQANDFSSMALQSDQFNASKSLRNVVFSNITVGASGRVTFSVSATVDPATISYAKNLATIGRPEPTGQTEEPTL